MIKKTSDLLVRIKNVLIIVILVIILFFVVIALFGAFGVKILPEAPASQEITVVGVIEKFIVPKDIQFTLVVAVNGPTTDSASIQASSYLVELKKELVKIGIPETDIISGDVQTYQAGTNSYRSTRTVTAGVSSIEQAKKVMDLNELWSVVRVNQVRDFENPILGDEILGELRQEAIEEAQSEAERLAVELGGKVRKVKNFKGDAKILPYKKVSTEDARKLDDVSEKLGYYAVYTASVTYRMDF